LHRLRPQGSLDAETLKQQREADPEGAVSEWDALFRDDIAGFLDDPLVDRSIDYGRPLEIPPAQYNFQNPIQYTGFTDSSGGRGDAYAIAIGHKDPHGDDHIIDVVRTTQPPFDPQEVTKQYAELCREYRVTRIYGDHYGAEWVAGAWMKHGITYLTSPIPKSKIYLEVLPLFTRGLVRIPDHSTLIRELRLLERQTHRSSQPPKEWP
jgi:hypothetical protein